MFALPVKADRVTLQVNSKDPTQLDVLLDRVYAGTVFSRAYSDFELSGAGWIPTPGHLAAWAGGYLDSVQNQHASLPGTFDRIEVGAYHFANADGVRLGWIYLEDGIVREQMLLYLVTIPNGIEFIQAAYEPSDPRQGGFPKDDALAKSVGVLDQTLQSAKLPGSANP